MSSDPWKAQLPARERGKRFISMNVKKNPGNHLGRLTGREGEREGEREGGSGAPVTAQGLSSPGTPWMRMDDWPYCDHQEPAVLQLRK
jgi:hypothetical protein